MPVRAVAFDFNGTLSDDEPILYAVYAELFAEQGKPLSERAYYGELLGAAPGETLAFEDTEAGVASAKSAGLRVVGVTRTLGAERLAVAHELIHRLDAAALARFLR